MRGLNPNVGSALPTAPLPEEGLLNSAPVAAFPSPRVEPLCYPGVRPAYSFVLNAGEVYPLQVADGAEGPTFVLGSASAGLELNEVLRLSGVATMEERVPVVGFGSNACPGQLAEKFSVAQNKWGDITASGDHHTAPALRGSLHDVAAVYSSKLGIHGYVFGELIDTPGATTDVFVNFLSPGQLRRMVRSENAYELCDLGEVSIEGLATAITAYGFVGKNEVLLDASGNPILLESAHTRGVDLPSMNQEEVLSMLAAEFGAQLDARYPEAPFYANTVSNLMAYVWYRWEFLRRPAAVYKHDPADGAEPDPLIGVTLQEILRTEGRTADNKLLDRLPAGKRGVTPRTFGELYNEQHGGARENRL